MPPIPKFPGLRQLIGEAAPALAREGTESIAAKTATAEEKEFLDMLRQQMAEREAFKSEFNLPTAHGTSGEKIAQHMDILDKMELEKKLGSDFLLRSEIASKVPDLTIKEFAPHEALHGTGIYSHPYDPKELSYLGPNYKANEYAVGRGEQIIPLRVRGNKTFNFDNNIHHSVSDKVLTRDQSFQKLSKLTGTPVDELKQLSAYDIEKLARRYPDQFENITFQGQVKTFKPESLRGEFAEYDPLKRKSGDYMSGLAGATGLGAAAMSSSEAKAETLSKPSISQDLEYPLDPRQNVNINAKGLKESLEDFLRNFAVVAPRGQQEGVESDISPIDLITPGMITAPAKALGKGAVALGREAIEAVPRILGNEVGELTLPQMRNVAKLMGKNPTERQLAEAAELPTGGRLRDYIERRNKEIELSDFAHKERLGIPHDTPGEQVLEKVKGAHTELTGPADIDVTIDPDIANFGEYRDFGNERRLTSIPSGIFIKNPNKNPAGVLAHELGHAIDMKIFPFAPGSNEILPSYIPLAEHQHQIQDLITNYIYNNKYNTAEKILALNPNLNFEEAYALARNIEKMGSDDAFNAILKINKDIINAQDISKAGHHYRYPRNFEMQRTMELLDPNKPFSGPSLAENARIISEVSQANPSSAQEAIKLYTEKGFPNIQKLLKEMERLKNLPKDYFDKARAKDTQRILEENEKKMAEEAAARAAYKAEFDPGWYHGTHLGKTEGNVIEEFNPNSFFTKDPDFANLHTGTYSGKQGSHIIPASLNVKNFFNPEDPLQLKTLEKFLVKQYKKNPEMQLFEKMTYPNENYFIDPSKRAKHIIDTLKRKIDAKESTWSILEDKNIEQALKNAGYEGSFLTEMGRPTAVSYAPKNVRMPWAKFDPAKKESGDILAGLAAAGLSFDQIKELLNKKSTDKDNDL